MIGVDQDNNTGRQDTDPCKSRRKFHYFDVNFVEFWRDYVLEHESPLTPLIWLGVMQTLSNSVNWRDCRFLRKWESDHHHHHHPSPPHQHHSIIHLVPSSISLIKNWVIIMRPIDLISILRNKLFDSPDLKCNSRRIRILLLLDHNRPSTSPHLGFLSESERAAPRPRSEMTVVWKIVPQNRRLTQMLAHTH